MSNLSAVWLSCLRQWKPSSGRTSSCSFQYNKPSTPIVALKVRASNYFLEMYPVHLTCLNEGWGWVERGDLRGKGTRRIRGIDNKDAGPWFR